MWCPAERERQLSSGQTHPRRSSTPEHLIRRRDRYQSSTIETKHDGAKEELPGFLRLSQVGNFLLHNPCDGSISAGSQGRSIAPTSPWRRFISSSAPRRQHGSSGATPALRDNKHFNSVYTPRLVFTLAGHFSLLKQRQINELRCRLSAAPVFHRRINDAVRAPELFAFSHSEAAP